VGQQSAVRIARDLELEPNRVLRVLRRRGVLIRKVATPLDTETRGRIEQLRTEGVLSTWIREETGRSLSVIGRVCQNSQAEAEWHAVWPKIRSNPALLALHREFSPKAKA
jgi:hypothetical protein